MCLKYAGYILVATFWLNMLSACGALDESSSSAPDGQLSGLWLGTTTQVSGTASEELTTAVIFDQFNVYVLREDQIMFGQYQLQENKSTSWDFDMTIYPYAESNIDTDNQFYVGTESGDLLELSGIRTINDELRLNYVLENNQGGSIFATLDAGQATDISQRQLTGPWQTTDALMDITASSVHLAEFSGYNTATSCQWEGTLNRYTSLLLKLSIKRENCSAFNQGIREAEGLALIDGNGTLHFVAQDNLDVLWMQFSASTTTPPADDGEEEPAEEDPAAEEEEAPADP